MGLRRTHNEDSLCADPPLGLYVVCDGIGGMSKGEVASRLAVEVIQTHLREARQDTNLPVVGEYDGSVSVQTNRLASAIRLANETINNEAGAKAYHNGMGTTVVSAVITDHVLSLAHVGDSRAYLIRGEAIEPMTVDHSLVAELIQQGLLTHEEAERSPQRNVVTRAVGINQTVEVELKEAPLMKDDVLLLCSDGLTRGVNPDEILGVIRREPDPQLAAERLVTMANEAGGKDNTSVVVLVIREDTGQKA